MKSLENAKSSAPSQCHAQLFLKGRQFAEVDRPPQAPGKEAGETQPENFRHSGVMPDSRKLAQSGKAVRCDCVAGKKLAEARISTYAKFIVDTATSLGQGGDKGFFKSQAQTHIAHALEMLFELNRAVTLLNACELLSDRELLEEEMENLEALLEPRAGPLCMPTSQIAF